MSLIETLEKIGTSGHSQTGLFPGNPLLHVESFSFLISEHSLSEKTFKTDHEDLFFPGPLTLTDLVRKDLHLQNYVLTWDT